MKHIRHLLLSIIFVISLFGSTVKAENDELNITVNNVNKMGVLGFIKLKPSDDIEGSPLIVMVPKEYFDENASFNFNDINVGQQMDVMVVG